MLRILLRISSLIDSLSERVGGVSVWLVIITVLVGFYNVVVRYMGQYIGMQLTSNLLIEMQWYLYSLVFFLGFAYILKNGINVRVDFIYANWSRRRKAMLDFWGHLFLLVPYCVIGIWVTVHPVMTSWRQWEMSPDPDGLPRAPLKTMIIVAFALLLLQAISELSQGVRSFARGRGRDRRSGGAPGGSADRVGPERSTEGPFGRPSIRRKMN